MKSLKFYSFFLFGLLALFPLSNIVFADPAGGSPTMGVEPNQNGMHLHPDTKVSQKSGAPDGAPGVIRGMCMIVASSSNPVESVCANLMLVLKDTDGKEITRDRTSPEGAFSFPAEAGKAYTLGAGSRFYENSTPHAVAHVGQNLQLLLIQK